MVMMLSQSCCGCTLRTGSIILAVLLGAFAIMDLVRSSLDLNKTNKLLNVERTFVDAHENAATKHEREDRIEELTMEKYITIGKIVFCCFFILVNLLLLLGAIKNKAGLVIIWVWTYLILLTLVIIFYIFVIVEMFINNLIVPALISTLFFGLYTALSVYCILVVYSFYRFLNNSMIPVPTSMPMGKI